jgi:hypothetical protein
MDVTSDDNNSNDILFAGVSQGTDLDLVTQ